VIMPTFHLNGFDDFHYALKFDYILVVGLQPSILPMLLRALQKYPRLIVAVLYEEFSVYYAELVVLFQPAHVDVQRRLVFLTNLPLWNDYSDESADKFPHLKRYHTYFNGNITSPASLWTWYATSLLPSVFRSQFGNTSVSLVSAFYQYSSYVSGRLVLSGFSWDFANPGSSSNQNYGATAMSLTPIARVFNLSEPVLFDNLDMKVTRPPPATFNYNLLLSAIIPFSIDICVIVGIIFYLLYWRSSRDNKMAPKDPNRPVTLMFTDIQSSTSLWALFPEQMLVAMDAHHRIIRTQIEKYECYEVKTIGDSFMIACNDPITAVELATGIQTALFDYNWNTRLMDKFYCSSTRKQGETESMSHSRTKFDTGEVVLSEEYLKLWNGLRVRIGFHTGFCEIRFDEVTKGWDYYGDTVNTAARTESKSLTTQPKYLV